MAQIALQVGDLIVEPGSENSSLVLKDKNGQTLGVLYFTDLEKRNSEEVLKKSYKGKKMKISFQVLSEKLLFKTF